MNPVLLLPLLLTGAPASTQPAAAPHDDPPIQLWISNDRRFLPGDNAKVQVRTEEDGYLIVLHVDPDGYLRVLFPLDPDKDNFVRGGKKYEVRGRGGREAFEVDGKGRGTVYAAVSREPFRFEGFVVGDHWDYRALAPSRLSSNPETELNELIRRMALGSFDYDILDYNVIERVAYASDYSSTYYGPSYYDPWCYSFSCGRAYYGSPFSVSIFFGRPYRRYYYDPYFYAYDPFYNPFFYDPYYYAPIYYPRYVYPRRFYSYPYRDRFYYDRFRVYAPYTPYRFRGADGFTAGYRTRGTDLRRSVNTVYNPPISPLREPATASPARRVIEAPAAELPRGTARRPLIENARRAVDRPIEARRARPVDQASVRPAGEPRLIRREVEARRTQAQTERSGQEPRQVGRASEEPRQVGGRGRDEPRQVGPVREGPRRAERAPGPGARPAPRTEQGRAAPSDRGGGRVEGRSSGGRSRSEGGSRPSGDDGRRTR